MRLFRNVANMAMDTNDVEAFDVNALGGADTVDRQGISGTGLARVDANLAAIGGVTTARRTTSSSTPPRATTWSSLNGRTGAPMSSAWPREISVTGADAGNDRITVNAPPVTT